MVFSLGSNSNKNSLPNSFFSARLFEQRRDRDLDLPIRNVMTAHPLTIPLGSRMVQAVELMRERKISELPVVDAEGRPVGLIDVTDVVGVLPQEPDEGSGGEAAPACRVFREPDGRRTA